MRQNKNTRQKILRQGDVLFTPVDNLPSGAKETDNIVAYGEATGHHHRVSSGGQVYELQQTKYVVVPEGASVVVTHEEHKPVPLSAGVYQVTQQREYDPVAERQIRD